MKKKELLFGSESPVMLPKGIKGAAKGVILTGRVKKTSEGKVLETDVWYKKQLVAMHFTGNKGYWNYDPRNENWDGCKIGSIFEVGAYTDGIYPVRETRAYTEAVMEFFSLKDEKWSSWHHVSVLESNITHDKKTKALHRKIERLTKNSTELTPDLPEDFLAFVKKHKPDNGKHVGIQLYQKSKNKAAGYIERQFRVENARGRLIITEECRGMAAGPGNWWSNWVYGCYCGSYGVKQDWYDRKNVSCVCSLLRKFFIYDGNIADLGLTERQQNVLKQIISIVPECEWSFVLRMIRNDYECTVLEQMLKAGLTKAVSEFMSCSFYGVSTDSERNSLSGYLKIEPQQLAYLKEINGGWRSIYFLQRDHDMKLRPEQLMLLEKNVSTKNLNEMEEIVFKFRLPIQHVAKLLGNRSGKMRTADIITYTDYLNMAVARGTDPHDEIIYRNKRWGEFHDRYVEELNARRAAEAAEKRRQELKGKDDKFRGIKKDYRRNVKLFGWKKNGYIIEIPKSYLDIITEGQLQHHCVGASDTYMLKMANRESFILFLRKAEDPDKPYYTIEATTDMIKQAYAAYDRKPDWEEVKPVLDAWMQDVKKNFKKMKLEETEKENGKELLKAAG